MQVSTTVEEGPKIPTATVAPRMETPKMNTTANESGSDFKEDPFQNYRYEDPFMISDPFQDEETPQPKAIKEAEVAAVFKGKENLNIYLIY